MAYFVHKQLIPTDTATGDPNWAKRQIWVLRLNQNDTIDEFETIEEAQTKVGVLFNEDPTGRIYKVVLRNSDGTFSDICPGIIVSQLIATVYFYLVPVKQ